MPAKWIASALLAVALVATYTSGAYRHLVVSPAKRTALERPVPGVNPNALESGCAAWGETLSTCLSKPESTDDFPDGDPVRM